MVMNFCWAPTGVAAATSAVATTARTSRPANSLVPMTRSFARLRGVATPLGESHDVLVLSDSSRWTRRAPDRRGAADADGGACGARSGGPRGRGGGDGGRGLASGEPVEEDRPLRRLGQHGVG